MDADSRNSAPGASAKMSSGRNKPVLWYRCTEVAAHRMSRLFQHRHHIRRLLFRTAVSLVLVAVLLWRIDLGQAGRSLRDANYVYVIPALTLFGVAKILVAQRWRLMMSEFAELPLSQLFGIL